MVLNRDFRLETPLFDLPVKGSHLPDKQSAETDL
jgi:hypothetical protein